MKQKRQSLGVLSESLELRRFFSSLNILTHHADAANDGANLAETVLTPLNVNATDFGKQFTNTVDGGDVIAQPLYMQNVNITAGSSQGVHSVVFVATEADGLYALDANTGITLWHDNFTNIIDPANLNPTTNVTPILQADIDGNPDVGVQLGILATPAIDPNAGILYLNANTKEIRNDGKHFVQRLWAVSIYNGSAAMSPTVIGDTIAPDGLSITGPYTYVAGPIINGTGNNNPAGNPTPVYPDTDGWVAAPGNATGYVLAFNAIEQMERTAVSLINGTVYLGFASHGDDGPYYGWILGYNATTLTLNAAFNTCPTFESSAVVGSSQPFWALGGVWMSGSNIASDGTNLYIVTGNGAFDGTAANFDTNGFPIDHDYGDSVLKLTPDSSTTSAQNGNGWGLKVSDFFTPSNQLQLNNLDLDLGSGGATLLPNTILDKAGNPMLVVGGKESRIYLLDRNNLGKFNTSYPANSTTVDPAGYDHVVSEYANAGLDTENAQIYSSAAYWNGNIYMGIRGQSAIELKVAAILAGSYSPVLTTLAFGYPGDTLEVSANGNTNGVAWALDPGGSDLVAFNASSFVGTLYDSNTTAGDSLGGSIHFHVPTQASGMVYTGSRGGGLGGYGLKLSFLNSNSTYFSSPTGLTQTVAQAGVVHLSWISNSSLATEFRVDRSTDGTTWNTLSYVPGATTSYDDSAIAANTKYSYRVVAVSGANLSPYSGTVVYNPPVNLTGQNNYIRLDPNGTNVDLYNNASGNGSPTESFILSQVAGVNFTGIGTTDSLTVDFTNGNPLPTAGLNFNGGLGISTLNVIGGNGNLNVTVNASTLTVNSTFGSVPISYINTGSIIFSGGSGINVLTQSAVPAGGAAVLFTNATAADTLNVSAGSMVIPMPASGSTIPAAQLGTLSIGSNARVSLSAPTGVAGLAVLSLNYLNLAGSITGWQSQLDLNGNDLIVHSTSQNAVAALATITSELKSGYTNGAWTGLGIASSVAASDSSHLTTLAAIKNDPGTGSALYSSFDGITVSVNDILIKSTYYGDTNLNGTVDGTDYTRIDNGYLQHLTGWINGDYNYDGFVDGSDYTLVDNAFNTQDSTNPARLAFINAATTVTVGGSPASLTVQLRTPLGNIAIAPAGGVLITFSSTSMSGIFASNAIMLTSVLIPSGLSSATFTYSDSTVGIPTVTAHAPGLLAASQTVTVLPVSTATQLAALSSPLNQTVGANGPVTIVLEDVSGNLIAAGSGGVTVNLTTNSLSGGFKNTSGGMIASVLIPAGSSSSSLIYTDSKPGVPVVTLSASGLAPAIQQETITAALSTIVFTTPAHTMILGASPATITLQLEDQAGNPIAAGVGGVVINFSSTSSGGTFYNSGNGVISSLVIASGSSRGTVVYRDAQLGLPIITASTAGLAAITQQQSVSGLPSGTAAFYGFGSSAGLLTDASSSGNTLKVGGGTVTATTTGLMPGFTGAATFSNNGYLTTSSGSFPINVPTGNSSYTIAAWININNANKNGITGWGNWGSNGQVNAFRTTQGDSAPDGAGLDNYWWANDYILPTSNLVNNWVYAAVTYDGSARSVYLNGVLLGTFANGNDNAQPTNFRIGSTNNGEYFGGTMADLLIAKTALSVSQIDALYNGT